MSGTPSEASLPNIASLTPSYTPEEIKRVEEAFALVDSRGGDVDELAHESGVAVDVVQAMLGDAAITPRLLAAQRAAEDTGRLLKPVAARLTLDMLNKLDEELQAGTLDADDIGNLLPKVHKVVEHADRMEAGRGDGNDGLATFHITFISGAGFQARVVPPVDEVVDIEADEVPE